MDFLCDECTRHFSAVRRHLDALRLPYELNPRLVRGLDYYTKTVFELISPDLGAQDALAGGGRYDGLVAELGGKPTPGVGLAAGVERILLVLAELGKAPPAAPVADVFVAHVGAEARPAAVELAFALRRAGLAVELDYMDRSLKAQMKAANRLGVRHVVILGEAELARGVCLLRAMEAGDEREVPLAELGEVLGRCLTR